MSKKMKDRSNERGVALLVVLWIVATSAIIVAAFNATARTGAKVVFSEIGIGQQQAAFNAALEFGVAKLLDVNPKVGFSGGGKDYQFGFGGFDLKVFIRDENGLIDLNKTDLKILSALVKRAKGSIKQKALLLRQIEGRRAPLRNKENEDTDSARGTNFLGGDERPGDIMNVPLPDESGASKEGQQTRKTVRLLNPFRDVTDLLALEGMTLSFYDSLVPHVTVFGKDGKINPRTAKDDVLLSVPNVSRADIAIFRKAAKGKSSAGKNALPKIFNRGRKYFSLTPGPGYRIAVEIARPDGSLKSQRYFTVLLNLDGKRPYRLVASSAY